MIKNIIIPCLFFSFYPIFSQDTNKVRLKIDGVSAVVGDYVILNSDIDKAYIDLESQGVLTSDITRCSLLGKLMEDKLYAHHAEQDSIEVDSENIQNYVEQTIDYFVSRFGTVEKVLEYYKKTSEQSFRNELFEINRIQQLSQQMQAKIIEDIEVTPEEVKAFFEKIPVDDLPIFGAELEVSQIVVEPLVSISEEKLSLIHI